MKLDKDQKNFLKYLLVYSVAFTVLNPPIQSLFRKTAIHWQDFLYAALAAVCLSIFIGLFVVGSKIRKK